MQCIFWYPTAQGIQLKDTITDKAVHYIGYTLKAAIKAHRAAYNLKGKHFRVIRL